MSDQTPPLPGFVRTVLVDPFEIYVGPVFETGAENYGWLNRIVGVGTGRRPPEGPVYDIYEVL